MGLTRSEVRDLRDQLQAILTANGIEGFRMAVGNGTYTDSSVTFKVEIAELSDNGEAMTKEAVEFQRMARLGLVKVPADKLFQTFTSVGRKFRLMGYNRRAKKFPFLAENVTTGAMHKFPAKTIERAFGC